MKLLHVFVNGKLLLKIRLIKCLRTDNGFEFCNSSFVSFCKEHGIERTCTYTPQQNGVAERMNRIVMEKVRCLQLTLQHT